MDQISTGSQTIDINERSSISIPPTPPSVPSSSSSPFNQIFGSLSTNPYFGAGAGLAGIGLCLSIVKRALIVSNLFLRRRFVISLQINNEDSAYPWLLNYINRHSIRQARQLSVHTTVVQTESGRTITNATFLPGLCNIFVYFYVERQREKQVIQRDGNRTPLETVTLTTLGSDVGFLKKLLHQATDEALSNVETGLVIYKAVGAEWRRFGNPARKRPLASVILDKDVAQRIVTDIKEFCSSCAWYTERGIPYRRGYLFYGPPGSGKSSFISALASHFGYSICMLSLSDRTLDDDRLIHLLNTPPPYSMVLLEDVDAAFGSRDDPVQSSKAYEGLTRVTFSGLLNAIDGVACAEERILFMTTNHVDRLDAALVRPGRVDFKQYFGFCTPIMFSQMFRHFYGGIVTDEMAQKFQEAATSLKMELSPAQIQGYLLLRKEAPHSAINDISLIADSKFN